MVAGILRRYVTGILPRYVLGQILKAYVLALTTLTLVFVLFVVVGKMTEVGLGPRDILLILPFAVPSSLPYTAPVALLFAVSVVYGRIGSDNEVLAIKASGQGAMLVLCPALVLGAVLSLGLYGLSTEVIPRATKEARVAIFRNIEDMFYRVLKKDREFDNPTWPFHIKVGDVEDRMLIDAYFRHRSNQPDGDNPFDMTVYAEKASIHFDTDRELVTVKLIDAQATGTADRPDLIFIDNDRLEIPLPSERGFQIAPPVQELTSDQIVARQVQRRRQLREERLRQAIGAALWITSGRIERVGWDEIHQAFVDYDYWKRDLLKLETEKHMRIAVSCGALFFALLGSPVGIRRARGDFLSAFIVCFLPIIVLYYPLILLGVNAGKEGMLSPMIALWMGNLLLGILSGFALQPVLKH
ncbi:LptF/LptG family permease [soil metagenome]